jgi:A/G-specific adenine glycosylase
MVSEFMLQQTQAHRVVPYWEAWLQRWPTPADLAADELAEALRMWGRLGYPRRAKRLHESARLIVERHGGQVPSATEDLRALPGVGEYTAAAIQAFAFGSPAVVLDTNVRRVIARAVTGSSRAGPSISNAERALAATLSEHGWTWSAAAMELGAVICTARVPQCAECPVLDLCAWAAAGYPDDSPAPRARPAFHGSDRQARGQIMAALREHRPVPDLDSMRFDRARASLIADGLIEIGPDGGLRLATGT